MKASLFFSALFLCSPHLLSAASYTQLSTPLCDRENGVIYDGKGKFTVQSPAETTVELTVSYPSLLSYINSNDYKSGNPMLLWDADAADYGLADNADTGHPAGARVPYLTGFSENKVWNPGVNINPEQLKQHVSPAGDLTLCLRNSNSGGVTVSVRDSKGEEHHLYTAPALRVSANKAIVGYHVNTNYVTAVTLHTPSTLDTASYEPPPDYTAPFVSKRADGSGIGRVMFLGDSITHGVNDQTWRWQLFKTLVDNGIEAQIVGPRSGYTPGYTNLTTPDAGESYGGVAFPNVHLAQSSGRTHNIISGSNAGMSGVNYGGHSTRSSAASYNCDTWCCMIGTNDLLSDKGYSAAEFADKMQRMLGGRVNARGSRYTWIPGKDWGTMGQLANDVLQDAGDVLYVMAVPCWGRHGNNNEADRHLAVQQYNPLLKKWVEEYAKEHGKNVIFVDINEGLVDYALKTPFSWPDAMSNRPGRDGLHPNAQGSLIIAGNLTRAMGLAGRTAGLPRAAAAGDWQSAGMRKKGPRALNCAENAFTGGKGLTVDCLATFGNGEKGGWRNADSALSISVGDGAASGTLRISESSILWGNTPLYCGDCSALQQNLRIVLHPGNQAGNVQPGFYVWLGDMLIGQGLAANSGVPFNGIRISAENGGSVTRLRWADRAYAPASGGKAAPNVYLTTPGS